MPERSYRKLSPFQLARLFSAGRQADYSGSGCVNERIYSWCCVGACPVRNLKQCNIEAGGEPKAGSCIVRFNNHHRLDGFLMGRRCINLAIFVVLVLSRSE